MSVRATVRVCPHCSASCVAEHQYCPACGFPVGSLSSVSGDKFIGKVLPGGYYILDLISVGGMGRVYRAEQSTLGRTVAVKIIHPHLMSDENSAARFITEARAASRLNHPNSVAVYDFGRMEDGQPYLVMEFLRGKDLARVVYEDGQLAFPIIVDVLRQVLAALGEAHDIGIVHRDLKPENIILEPLRRGGNFVKVVDFGLAKLRADAGGPGVTSPGIVCGTPDYMAPEQGRGDAIDGRTDLYAVGVILFQLLTGKLPFDAESPTQVVMMHLTLPPPDPRQVAPAREIPQQLVDVVLKALSKDPAHRYQDALELSEALKSALLEAQSHPPEQRFSVPPGSVAAGGITCPACQSLVPIAKFCLECGARLPAKSGAAENSFPKLPLPLIAREDDLHWLQDLRQAAQHHLIVAELVGDAGAGKTRLLREFLAQARAEGDVTVLTGPDPIYAEVAYHALRVSIAELAEVSETSSYDLAFATASNSAHSALTEIFSGMPPPGDTRGPAERRQGLAEALEWAIERALRRSASNRVVLAVDDVYRIDGTSRNAFLDVLARIRASRVLFVATHVPGFEFDFGAVAQARMIHGLPPTAIARLIRPSRSNLRILADETKGVLPMHVEQLIRYAQEGGGDAPGRLADVIALRIDTLEPQARLLLQTLAVIGDQVARETLAELLPRMENLDRALSVLKRAGMIEFEGGRVSASHPLIREIALMGIPAAARKDLHNKALGACEKLAAPLEVRAHHAYYAGDSFQALCLLEQVADRSSARGDPVTEVLALRRGLEMARREISRGELDDPLRAVVIFGKKLGNSLTKLGNLADAEGVLREALDFVGPSGKDRAGVLSALAHVAHGRQRPSEALGYIEQAIEVAKESGAYELVAMLTDTRKAWAC